MLRSNKENDYDSDSVAEQLESAIKSIEAIKLENEKARIEDEIRHQKQMLYVYRSNSQNMTVSYLSYIEAGINDDIRRLQKELKDVGKAKKEYMNCCPFCGAHQKLSFEKSKEKL